METTKNKLPENYNIFFNNMSNYLDTKIYYYGSVQRQDYLYNSSDIDIDIFTENEFSTIYKLIHFLDIKKKQVSKFIFKGDISQNLIKGHKIIYNKNNLKVEISIYNEKNKKEILHEHNKGANLPFIIVWSLLILKFIYYRLRIIPDKLYKKMKFIIINILKKKDTGVFIVFGTL
jgi:hypothetical protein